MSAIENFEKLVGQVQSGKMDLLSEMDVAFENVVCEGTEEEVSRSMQLMESFLIAHLCDIEETFEKSAA
ncbi:MAG: hypothetical protein AB7F59_04880 [Bdellovibrionales bacterium]